MAAPAVHQLQGYKRHITSEFLKDRYPYLEDINGHLKRDDVSMAFGSRLFPRLVEQLTTPGMAPETLCEALRTICDLCSNQENKCEAIASDVVAAATNLLMHESVLVKRDAARVIGSMALLIVGRSNMPVGNTAMAKKLTSSTGAGATLPRLAKLLFDKDELVQMNAARAMQAITVFRDGCQQVVDQDTVRKIAQYLNATLPDIPRTEPLSLCLLYLLQTLAAVTMYANGGMKDLFGVSFIKNLLGFLERVPEDGKLPHAPPTESMETLRQALRVLWHCGNDPRGRKETLQAQGVRVITGYLMTGDPKVREAAVCALNVASLETQGKRDILEHSQEGLATLLNNGDSETPYLHETCVQLVRCASELPAFRFSFARRIVEAKSLLEKIYGTAALAAIGPLLQPKEALATRTKAAEVTVYFLETQSEGDRIKVPPVCPTDNGQSSADFALEECIDIFHNLVSLLHEPTAKDVAMRCLEALCRSKRPREELAQLLADSRVDPPEACRADLQEMASGGDAAEN